ncbi:hypothetical protein FRX31_006453 [Thalictrum thalictroides]|uniref:Uncharacterized protein n=1 Tax=Thalictrum thalictroides TaxID=46969 RepID=A0A7J6X2L0_THATH|nr:hypothetical protein FRX31_006453 [Thalictrum thalictroides]
MAPTFQLSTPLFHIITHIHHTSRNMQTCYYLSCRFLLPGWEVRGREAIAWTRGAKDDHICV